MKTRMAWTPEDDAAIRAAYRDLAPDAVRRIARSLGRGYQVTRVRANKLGVLRRDADGKKIKSGFRKDPVSRITAPDPTQDVYKAWRPPVHEA